VKRHYRMGQFKTASQLEVEKRVKDDDEVLFWGDALPAILSIEEDINQALLELSVSLYVPFRGFTFTSCWMEQYMQAMIQEVYSKGLQPTQVVATQLSIFSTPVAFLIECQLQSLTCTCIFCITVISP